MIPTLAGAEEQVCLKPEPREKLTISARPNSNRSVMPTSKKAVVSEVSAEPTPNVRTLKMLLQWKDSSVLRKILAWDSEEMTPRLSLLEDPQYSPEVLAPEKKLVSLPVAQEPELELAALLCLPEVVTMLVVDLPLVLVVAPQLVPKAVELSPHLRVAVPAAGARATRIENDSTIIVTYIIL
jgi:hypothetical protein